MPAARYLIRFDDACPTANWAAWEEAEALMSAYGLRPIVAVIPENRDPTQVYGPPAPDFWSRVRRWRDLGWTIGMHGYQHRFSTRNAGVMGINSYSEFAGVPYTDQVRKLRAGSAIMSGEGLQPRVWVAPAHSFDDNTVRALGEVFGDSMVISDGLFPYPGRDRRGVMWVPQQLWRFRSLPAGVWTICAHPSQWTKEQIPSFRAALDALRGAVTDLEEVVRIYGSRRRGPGDDCFAVLWRLALRFKTGCGKRRAPRAAFVEQES